MYGEVLLPTDGSQAASRAMDHAVDLAKRHGARLKVLHVIDISLTEQGPRSLWADWDRMAKRLHEEGHGLVGAVVESAKDAGVKAEGVVMAKNNVPEAILGYVEEAGVDVIVMGTHGRSGVGRFLLGSVAERVSRGSKEPVLLVPAEERG